MLKKLTKLMEERRRKLLDRKIEKALSKPIKDIRLLNFLGEDMELSSDKHGIW